jgi:AcrR family transcriptional regulator
MSPAEVAAAEAASRRPIDPHRHANICGAALEVLHDVGYDRLTLDAVAGRAHASKATLYRHWPGGKAQLIVDAVKCRHQAEMATPDTGSLKGDLFSLLRSIGDVLTEEDGALILGLLFAMRSDPELGTAVREQMLTDKHRHGDQIVAQAMARGEVLRPDSAVLLTELMPALMFTYPLINGTSVDEALIQHVVQDVLVPLLTSVQTPNTSEETL